MGHRCRYSFQDKQPQQPILCTGAYRRTQPGLVYETVVSILDAASHKAQMIHNQELQAVETEAIGADEFWSFVKKNRRTVTPMN